MQLYHGSFEAVAPVVKVGEMAMIATNVFDGIFASDNKNIAASHGINVYTYDVENIATDADLGGNFEKVVSILRGEVSRYIDDETLEALAEDICNDENTGDYLDVLNPRVMKGDADDDARVSWEMQRLRGRVAAELGYGAVEMEDEHGTSYLIVA